jgi:hypothetical protein
MSARRVNPNGSKSRRQRIRHGAVLPSSQRVAARGPTSSAIKIVAATDRQLIDAALERKAKGWEL